MITYDFMMKIRWSINILAIITWEMVKLKTHNPIYCIEDYKENCLNLKHTFDRLYLTSTSHDIYIYIYTYISIYTKQPTKMVQPRLTRPREIWQQGEVWFDCHYKMSCRYIKMHSDICTHILAHLIYTNSFGNCNLGNWLYIRYSVWRSVPLGIVSHGHPARL